MLTSNFTQTANSAASLCFLLLVNCVVSIQDDGYPMNAKEIGRRAGRIFEYNLPEYWIFRSQEDQEDYGIDGEVELADSADHATGFIFKTQIKGQKNVKFIEDGSVVSFALPVERLKYYMRQVELPVFLVVVDVTTERIFWKSLQDDDSIRESLQAAIDRSQDTVSVHLSVADSLPDNHVGLIKAAKINMNWLRFSALNRITGPVNDIISRASGDILANMLQNTKELNFHLYSEQFERLYVVGNFDELYAVAHEVINSGTEKAETRFVSGLYIERVLLQRFGHKSDEFQAASLNLFLHLLHVVRTGKVPVHFRLYAILLVRGFLLNVAVSSDFHFYLSEKMAANDPLTKWVVDFSRAKVVVNAARNVEKTIHLVNRIILSSNKYVLLEALPRVVPKLSLFAHRLALDGLSEQAEYVYKWLDFGIALAINLARELTQQNFLAEMLVLNASFKLNTSEAQARIDESVRLSELIKSDTIRQSVIETIGRFQSSLGDSVADWSDKEEVEFFRERAKALGMDPDDPNNEFGRIINQGLKDYNPERVLRDCEHLLVFPSRAQGIPARMVGLPTAAMKWVCCKQKGHAIGGWSLDDIYESPLPVHGFKAEYCSECTLQKARAEDWKWSSKWQNEELEKNKDFVAKIKAI